jgi:hypothetical protein
LIIDQNFIKNERKEAKEKVVGALSALEHKRALEEMASAEPIVQD